MVAPADDTEGEACGRVLMGQLARCLLDAEWRAVDETVLQDVPWKDVCGHLGVPDSTVSRLRRRGLVKIHAEFRDVA